MSKKLIPAKGDLVQFVTFSNKCGRDIQRGVVQSYNPRYEWRPGEFTELVNIREAGGNVHLINAERVKVLRRKALRAKKNGVCS
jgi:hypothetical protein